MGFLGELRRNLNNAGSFAAAAGRKLGRAVHNGAASAWHNRDLIARGASLALPVFGAGAAGLAAGGPAGAVAGIGGAVATQQEEIKKFGKDVINRVRGKTKGGGNVDRKTKKDLLKKGVEAVSTKKVFDPGQIGRLRQLAQGTV